MEGSVDMEENNENEWEFMEGNAPAPLTEPEEALERFRKKDRCSTDGRSLTW